MKKKIIIFVSILGPFIVAVFGYKYISSFNEKSIDANLPMHNKNEINKIFKQMNVYDTRIKEIIENNKNTKVILKLKKNIDRNGENIITIEKNLNSELNDIMQAMSYIESQLSSIENELSDSSKKSAKLAEKLAKKVSDLKVEVNRIESIIINQDKSNL